MDERRLSKADRNGSVERARRPRLGRVRRPPGWWGCALPEALTPRLPEEVGRLEAPTSQGQGKEGPPRVDLAPELRRAELVGVLLPPAGSRRRWRNMAKHGPPAERQKTTIRAVSGALGAPERRRGVEAARSSGRDSEPL